MPDAATTDLLDALRNARAAVLWKLDGLAERDVRLPRTPTGTNLLGLVKHLSTVEALYLGWVLSSPVPDPPAWMHPEMPRGDDLWATADESREYLVATYRRVSAHADATVAATDPAATVDVPWAPFLGTGCPVHRVLVHVLTETYRHLGHTDIVREGIDGSAGNLPDDAALGSTDPAYWPRRRAEIEAAAGGNPG